MAADTGTAGHRFRVVEWVLKGLALLALLFTAGQFFGQGKVTAFAVTRGKSMYPVFSTHDLILFPPDSLNRTLRPAEVGDVIVYRAPAIPPVWAHRIIEEVEPGVFRTQGDNNHYPDAFTVKEADILGSFPPGVSDR